MEEILSQLNFEKGNGLLPTIVLDEDGKVLMLAYSSKESLQKTIELGKATYFSRSRKELWTKGLTSGNVQNIREIRIDCDGDTILFVVEQVGGSACHTGYDTCFYRKFEDGKLTVTGKKIFDPEEVYNEA